MATKRLKDLSLLELDVYGSGEAAEVSSWIKRDCSHANETAGRVMGRTRS